MGLGDSHNSDLRRVDHCGGLQVLGRHPQAVGFNPGHFIIPQGPANVKVPSSVASTANTIRYLSRMDINVGVPVTFGGLSSEIEQTRPHISILSACYEPRDPSHCTKLFTRASGGGFSPDYESEFANGGHSCAWFQNVTALDHRTFAVVVGCFWWRSRQ